MPSLSPPTLRRASARLRAAWRARWGLYTLTATSLCLSALSLMSLDLGIFALLGILVPWGLLLLSRFPWTTTAVMALSTACTIGTGEFTGTVVATWLALFILLRARRRPQALVIAAATAGGNLLAWHTGRSMGVFIQQQTSWFFICFGMAAVLRRADTSVARAETARTEALRNQRALIARELHDTLARANTHIVLLAQNARNNPHDHHQTTTALNDIITTGRQSVTDLRTMLRLLRQDTNTPLDPTPTTDLPTALTQAHHDLTTAGLHTTITHQGDLTNLPPTLTTTLTRILHESTANMIKHAAPDAQCTIQLDITDTHAELLVINPLANHHHDQQLSSGLGLLSIQERTHALGGTTTITPTDHQWILHTTLPLTPKDTPHPDQPTRHSTTAPAPPPSSTRSESDGAPGRPPVPPADALRRSAARLRAAWRARWGLYTLTATSLGFSIFDATQFGFHANQILGLLASAALLLLPRLPWTITAVIVLSEAYSIMTFQLTGATLATWFATGDLIYRRRYPQLALALLTLACADLTAWLMGQEVEPVLSFQTTTTVVSFGMAAVLRRADTSVARAETARTEALRNQRALIARELHDTLARANTHIVLLAQNARNNPHDHHQTTTALNDIITTGRQSVTDLRTMLRLLRQDTNTPLDPTPTTDLPTALTQAHHDLTTAGLHTTITHQGDLTNLPPTLTTTLTRILHESTANMIKHAAPDAQCTIQLDITDTHAELLVINPLANHHHDQQLSSGLGLLSIQERTHALGGTTTITPTDHQWILHTTLPLTPKDTP